MGDAQKDFIMSLNGILGFRKAYAMLLDFRNAYVMLLVISR